MERLTFTDEEIELIGCDCPVKTIGNVSEFCDEICDEFQSDCPFMKMGQRLKKYEETGLEPSQIAEIDRLYQAKCEEVEKLKKEIAQLNITIKTLAIEPEKEKLDEAYDLGYQSCLRNKGLKWDEAEELQGYREKLADGRMAELPCNVSDMVYVLMHRNTVTEIMTGTVTNVRRYEDGTWYVEFSDLWLDMKFEDFGKTAFLSREKAEQALKESEG